MLYSPTTQILTVNGWLPIAEAVNPIGLKNSTNRITKFKCSLSVGTTTVRQFVILQDEYIDTCISDDAIEDGTAFLLATDKVETETNDWSFQEIYLLGMILTDAYYNQSGGIEIYQSAKKSHVVQRIDEALSKSGFTGSLSQRERGGKHYTWRIGKASADEFKRKFHLMQRGTPDIDLLFMPNDKRGHLLNAMMDGDGTWNDRQTYGVFYKPQIIDFFQLLAMTLGYKSKVNDHRKQIYISMAGYCNHLNATIPEMKFVNKRVILLSIENATEHFYPTLKDNGKIFFGGLI